MITEDQLRLMREDAKRQNDATVVRWTTLALQGSAVHRATCARLLRAKAVRP